MLKTIRSLEELALKAFKAGNNKVVGGGCRVDETMKNLSKSKKSKNNKSENLTRIPTIGATGESTFLILNTKEVFNRLRQAFIKAPIFQHFDLESHIQIETDALRYAIGEVLSRLSFD